MHGAGGIAHLRVVDREPPAIPAVPAHGRSQGDLRPYFQQHLPFGFPEGILRCQQHPEIPFGGHTARYQARTGIELQPFGKPLRPVRHRAFAADHDRHQEGIARAGAVYERIVDLRRFGARGGQDIFTLGDRPGPDGQGLHLPARGDLHLQPVGMVVHDPVAGLLDQQQDFVQAGQVDVERTGSIALAHHAAAAGISAENRDQFDVRTVKDITQLHVRQRLFAKAQGGVFQIAEHRDVFVGFQGKFSRDYFHDLHLISGRSETSAA